MLCGQYYEKWFRFRSSRPTLPLPGRVAVPPENFVRAAIAADPGKECAEGMVRGKTAFSFLALLLTLSGFVVGEFCCRGMHFLLAILHGFRLSYALVQPGAALAEHR